VLAPGAARYLVPVGVVAVGLAVADIWIATPLRLVVAGSVVALLVVVGFFAQFFRDPERTPGPDIVSAADGHVQSVAHEAGRWHVAVFMNVTDVHVNRFPLDGDVLAIRDSGTGFRPAYGEDASHNVQRHYDLSTSLGPVEVVQLTGLVARRLVSLVRVGERHRKGDRLGMILLGSRVDVYLPSDRVEPLVRPGQRVTAGVTPIARERT
jgi:phosphatidylserine decarboxylase